jgi:uncharacterized protein (DUF849 family)
LIRPSTGPALGINRLLVERVARIAGELGRPIARPAEVREWLELISPPT